MRSRLASLPVPGGVSQDDPRAAVGVFYNQLPDAHRPWLLRRRARRQRKNDGEDSQHEGRDLEQSQLVVETVQLVPLVITRAGHGGYGMKRLCAPFALACAVLVGRAPIAAQAPPAAFEVVSVKPDLNPAAPIGIRPVVGNRFSAVVTVNVLIAVAYGERSALLESQIAGAPPWAATDRYEINATFDGPITAVPGGPPVRLMSMIHTLLADRFKLKIHKETRQVPVYDLVVASADGRLGPGLTKAPGTCVRVSGALPANVDFSALCGFKRVTPTLITAKGLRLDDFAGALGPRPDVQRPVRNRTGLGGEFDLELEYAPFSSPGDPPAGPGLATAMRDQLGLALRPTTGPVEVFVIDAVERPVAD